MTEVHICYEWEPTSRNHYHATGGWVVAGVVEDEQDVELWMDGFEETDEKDRKYRTVELNHVEAFYTKR